MGHECATASSGQEGYERAKQERPNLILMDVVMGDQNGFQTCRKLKRDPQTARIPVVLVTSKSGESDEYWGRMNGASGYLRKPFTPAALIEAVQQHVP